MQNLSPLVFFGLLTGSHRPFEAHPGANTFPPVSLRAHPLPATPFQCPRSRTATLGEGAAATYLPLRLSDCTLSRLRAEEYDRPVTQSIATPEPSSRTIPTLDRTLVARWSLECVATLGSRRSCPISADRFHQPCLLPWRTSYCHRNTAGLGRDR